ncbi:MAG: TonB-dependent receptor, partial [Bacteroidales bacterium]|nr:TonB-dependent receptor [Bacteroidales bacterium]
IIDVPAGDFVLEASAMGYDTTTKRIKVQASKSIVVDIILFQTPLELSEIVIKGDGFRKRNRSETVTTVLLSTIKELHLTSPLDILNFVPGVEIGAYHQGGVADAFSLRGFSGAGHEGQAAIEVDGVSLNEGEGNHDGYADMNLIIPLNISKVDVYKGPSSALFGRFGTAGTLAFATRKGGEYQDLSIKGGSFETVDAQIALGKPFKVGEKALKTNFAAQLYKTDGYKENSEFFKGNLNGRLAYELTDNTDIALNLKAYSGKWDATGYIPTEQLLDKDRRNNQAINAENDGGSKNFASERIDINHSFNNNLRLLVFGYAVQQNSQRYMKFGYEPGGQTESYVSRNLYGTGANLNGKNSIGSVEVNWLGGFEFFSELTDARKWNTSNRVRQDFSEDRSYDLQSYSFFGQAEFDINPYFRPTIGLRFDTYDGNLELHDPNSPSVNKPLNNLSHFSPKVGFRSTLVDGFDFKANVSNGFSLPDGAIRYDRDADVDPSEVWQYEAGIEYNYKSILNLNLTGFILNTSKEVSETVPGSGLFVNSGKTQRRGLELGLSAQPVKRLNLNGSLAFVKTEIKVNEDKSIEGNELNSVPRSVANVSLDYTFESGFGARINLRDVGKYATGLENFFYYKGYTRADAKLFYNFAGVYSYKGQFFIEVNNIFNKNYSNYVFDNGGPDDGQSYSASPMRSFSIGVSYNL